MFLVYFSISLVCIIVPAVLYWLPRPFLMLLCLPGVVFFLEDDENVDKRVFITIDDVPYDDGKHFPAILDVLEKYNVKASFFVISNFGRLQLPLLETAVSKGHELCNHGKTDRMHARLSEKMLREEISDCDEFLKTNLNTTGSTCYRPGSGICTDTMLRIAKEKGLHVVLGSNYPHDPYVRWNAMNFAYIRAHLRPGDIIVLHDRENTPALLDRLLPYLENQGYKVDLVGKTLEQHAI